MEQNLVYKYMSNNIDLSNIYRGRIVQLTEMIDLEKFLVDYKAYKENINKPDNKSDNNINVPV